MTKFSKKAGTKEEGYPPSNPVKLEGNKDTICVFDADELAFVVAAACEERFVDVTNKESTFTQRFKNRTEFKNFLKGITEDYSELFDIEDIQEAEPIEFALSTIKKRIEGICKQCGAGSYEMYISGQGNFRDNIPLPVKYKDQRKDLIKPKLLKEIRQYLKDHHNAIEVNGREADDALTSRMWDGYKNKQKIIAVTQDKDATQATGWLFNPNKMDEPIFIEPKLGELYLQDDKYVKGYGRLFLYFQMLFGDPTDNYCPRSVVKACTKKKPRFGEKAAYKLLKDCKSDKEAMQLVVDTYKEWFKDVHAYEDFNDTYIEVTWIDVLQMITDCAFMQRWEEDRLIVKDLLDKLGVEYENK